MVSGLEIIETHPIGGYSFKCRQAHHWSAFYKLDILGSVVAEM